MIPREHKSCLFFFFFFGTIQRPFPYTLLVITIIMLSAKENKRIFQCFLWFGLK